MFYTLFIFILFFWLPWKQFLDPPLYVLFIAGAANQQLILE